jgi:hypothetical protein
MINFRFHLVSLVAVFLALTVGIVMGAAVIDQAIVDGLNQRIDSVSARADERERENEALSGEVGRLEEFVEQAEPYVVEGRLPDVPVVVVAVRGTDEDVVADQVEMLREAGAVAPGIVWLEESWTMEGGDAAALAEALGETSDEPAARRDTAWRALATRLAAGREVGAVTTAPGTVPIAGDALTLLVEGGFAELSAVGDRTIDPGTFPGPDSRVVLVTSPGAAPGTGNLTRVGARALADAGVPAVVGEVYDDARDVDRGGTLGALREDESAAVSTVDDVDLREGRMAVVLAAADLGREPPVTGHYGYGTGATRALPEFRPRP